MEKIKELLACIFWYVVGALIIGVMIFGLLQIWWLILILFLACFAVAYVPIWLEKFLNLERTKKIIAASILGATLVLGGFVATQSDVGYTEVSSYTVYITNTGHKYHKNGCRYLRYSSHPISESKAKKDGYGACSVCNP